MKFFKKILAALILLSSTSCIHLEIKRAGVIEGASRTNENYLIDIPLGLHGEYAEQIKKNGHDGSKLRLGHLGDCGAQLSFTGIMIPIIPFWLPNFCESGGFNVGSATADKIGGITLQLHYNGTTYNPYIENGSVKFKIENFSAFKRATDKSLILHKRKPDGTIFTKELPFDWKIVVEVSGGL